MHLSESEGNWERQLRAWASGYTLAFLLSVVAIGWSSILWWAGAREVASGIGLGLSALATAVLGLLTLLQARLRRERVCAKCRRVYTFLTDPQAIVCLCGRCAAHLRF